ncbi:hypothetical protein PUN28_008877 [Cardiocondyla obscurior]
MNHNGQIVTDKPCSRSTGTTIQVKDLFKQIPVRRQIITNARKANQTIKLLEILMQCFGICKPNVRIQFRVNNNVTFTKPSLNNIKEAVNHILGRKIVSNMEWIESKSAEFTLQVMLPSKRAQDLSERSHPDLHYIFVNNRPIKHKDLEKLVNSLILEYFEQESRRRKMMFLVYLTLSPMDIDINLEPNKDAIFFKDQNKVFNAVEKCIRHFYGLKSVESSEQNVSNDTSACYEDYTFSLNENTPDTEQPVCKKRKIHTEERINQEDIIKEKTQLSNGNKCENFSKNNQQNDNQRCGNTLALTTHINPPNLSDSDSNDTFPAADKTNVNFEEDISTISQLPVVDLGEDFDIEEITHCNISMDKIEQKVDIQEKRQITLEAWSKGHVSGLEGGTNIKSDIAIEGKLEDNLNNTTVESDEIHIDHRDLNFLKHVRLQVAKEHPDTLTAAQKAKNITDFWKQLSSEERGYYRDIAGQEAKNTEWRQKKVERKVDANKMESEKNKNRLLQLFEKMKNKKNEKKEKLNMRTIVPWIIDRTKIITRSDFDSEHVIGRLTSNLWVATICERIWIVDILGLIKGLKVTDIDPDKIDAKKIERLLKQWLIERDDMSVMHSIHEFTKIV